MEGSRALKASHCRGESGGGEGILQAEGGERLVEAGDHEDPAGGQEVPRPPARGRPALCSASQGLNLNCSAILRIPTK